MKDWFSQLYVTKMTRTFCHVASTCKAARAAINDPLSRIHQATKFRAAALHGLWVFDASIFCYGHTTLSRREGKKIIRICIMSNMLSFNYHIMTHTEANFSNLQQLVISHLYHVFQKSTCLN